MRISDWSSDVCSSDLSGEKDAPAFCGAGNAGAFRHIISRTRPWAWAIEHPLRGGERPFLYIRRTRVTDGAPAFAGAKIGSASCRGKSVSVRVALGGRRILKKQIRITQENTHKN